MAFESITTTEIDVKRPVTKGLWTKVKNSLDFLNGAVTGASSNDIPNGSAEVDSDSDGTPDSWTKNTFAGGTVTRETAVNAHGAACFKMIHPGGASNGGGEWISDYVECAEVTPEILGVIHWATAAGMKNEVYVNFYTDAKVFISATTLYTSTANPTSATQLLLGFTPPATARYYKVYTVGGQTDTDVAGTAYFDGLTRQPHFRMGGVTMGAITGTNTTSSAWATIGSGTITFPFAINVPIRLSIACAAFGAAGDEVNTAANSGARVVINGVASTEIYSDGGGGSSGELATRTHGSVTIDLPTGTFGTAHGSKTLSVDLQCKRTSGTTTASAAIQANDVTVIL